MTTLVLRYQDAHTKWFGHRAFASFHAALVEAYPDIEFVWDELDGIGYAGYSTSPLVFTIRNPENNKYSCVSYWDAAIDLFGNKEFSGWDSENLEQLLTTPGSERVRVAIEESKKPEDQINYHLLRPYSQGHTKFPTHSRRIVYPFTYFPYRLGDEACDLDQYYNTRIPIEFRPTALGFRGMIYGNRLYTSQLISEPDIEITGNLLEFNMYFQEMASLTCVLSLSGMGEICNRDIEAMAVGTPVLRPALADSECDDPLIPDYHYIAFDYERSPITVRQNFGDPLGNDFSLVAESLVRRWNEVKTDYEFLEFVGENARQWYLRNGTVEGHTKLFMKLFDISRLF